MRALSFPFALAFSALAFSFAGASPVKVWIDLRDKGPVSLSGRAYENAPVHAPYLHALREAGFRTSVSLKWQNRVSGWAESSALAAIEALPFVLRVDELPRKAPVTVLPKIPAAFPDEARALSASATDRFWGFRGPFDSTGASALADTVAARSLRAGEGVRIAVIDEDFYLGHQAFDSLFARGGIADQWDFVDSVPQTAFPTLRAGSHGAWVLSLLAADLPGKAAGLAPYARYQLYRTEIAATEGYVEEDYLAAALERAVDSGAQVINVSLGYRYDFNADPEIPYSAMDGRTRPSTLAALGAARRGVLVIVAMGNEGVARVPEGGGAAEPTVVAPADADSILSVGMVDVTRARCFYSGTGPAFDGRLKPEVSALGPGAGCAVNLVNPGTDSAFHTQPGTSFAAPIITGIVALLRQLHPDASGVSAQRIRRALMETAAKSQSPDNLVGNGLANGVEAHCELLLGAPCPAVIPSVAVKSMFAWHGGNASLFSWPTDLDLSKARMWDLQGRARGVRGTLNEDGEVEIRSSKRLAPGSYLLRIPKLPDLTAP